MGYRADILFDGGFKTAMLSKRIAQARLQILCIEVWERFAYGKLSIANFKLQIEQT
jgi:hypothetical protein